MENIKVGNEIKFHNTGDRKIHTSYLIMNADDYGPSDYINDGIIKGIEEGIINSVSVMVTYQNMPDIPDFISKLDRLMSVVDKEVGIGLHLSLSGGKALTTDLVKIKRLLKKKSAGFFKGINRINITKRYVRHAEIELRNQIEFLSNYLKKYDREIDHLNHHAGFVAFHDRLWKCYVKVAREKDLPIRSPIGYMSTANLFYKNAILTGVTAEGIKQTIERWASNLFNLSPHRNLTDKPLKMFFARKNLMQKKFEYAKRKELWMPDVFNDNYYDKASPKKAINFLQSFSDNEIKEFMLHPSSEKSAKGIIPPHGIKKRSLKRRHRELKVLLESNLKRDDGTLVKLTDIIKGKSTIINLEGVEIRLKLILRRFKNIK